ncbi:hypothetical protein [Actinobacillus minor]|uniref:hypothetical protein n=1 Tax=Actinobacillus minor TaxID=51047 RepID=UPI0023EFF023|nr:hypothetical protein [Actinobacillus minor]MDD6911683.1 hypothetical protein [Actinobacillus minor]
MGLDMYIYRGNKDKFLKRKSLSEEYERIDKNITSTDEFKVFVDRMKQLDSDKTLSEDEHKIKFTELKKEYNDRFKDEITKSSGIRKQLDEIWDEFVEVGYWRKFWFLHNFLCKICNGCPNCEDTVITKEHMKTIIDTITEAIDKKDLNIIGEYDEYSCLYDIWDELDSANKDFKDWYAHYNDDEVYWYHPWY